MHRLFIDAKSDLEIELPKGAIAKLPSVVGIATTVQHAHKIADVKKSIEKEGKKAILVQGRRSQYAGQVLGCDVLDVKVSDEIEAFLYIGTGEFHPKELLISHNKPVFIYNPLAKRFYELGRDAVDRLIKQRKGAFLRFLSSKNIGVLVTTKPGQFNLAPLDELKSRYPDKDFFVMVADTIDFQGLEDFPFIDCYVNTACPRIGYDDQVSFVKAVINVDDILNSEKL